MTTGNTPPDAPTVNERRRAWLAANPTSRAARRDRITRILREHQNAGTDPRTDPRLAASFAAVARHRP